MGYQGTFAYPGVIAYESFDFTDLSGIDPAVGTLVMYPQDEFPDANGDITLQYIEDGASIVSTIVLKSMHIDSVSFHGDSGGKVCTVRFLDERWAWQFYFVTGNYNIRYPSGDVDPAHEHTPQELAAILFEALQVDDFDISQLPNDARPRCDWESANAAAELLKLCSELGCRIVPVRSAGSWRIVATGQGNDLPDDLPFESPGAGIDPHETPDYLKVVTAPIKYQVCLELKACCRDLDHAWRDLTDISFKPNGLPSNRAFQTAAEFGFDPVQFSNVSPQRFVQPDGTATSPQEIALANVFRKWRVSDTPSNVGQAVTNSGERIFWLPGYGDAVSRRQLIVSNELVESYTDELGVDHRRPAFIFGSYFGELAEVDGMYPAGTRIDHQGAIYLVHPEEPISFSIAIDDTDTDRTIISTSKQVMRFFQPGRFANGSPFGAATIFLACAVMVRDPETWQPRRYEKTLQVGNGNNPDFCHIIVQNDIQPWAIPGYNVFGQPLSGGDTFEKSPSGMRTNKAEVDQMCDYYLNSYARTFEIVGTQVRTYIGLFAIDLDGAIAQVQWTINKAGASTIVSRGTEHNFQIPSHEQRLQRNATKNEAAMAAYQLYRAERRMLLLGSDNTL